MSVIALELPSEDAPKGKAKLNLDLAAITSAQPVVAVDSSAVRFSHREMLRVKGPRPA